MTRDQFRAQAIMAAIEVLRGMLESVDDSSWRAVDNVEAAPLGRIDVVVLGIDPGCGYAHTMASVRFVERLGLVMPAGVLMGEARVIVVPRPALAHSVEAAFALGGLGAAVEAALVESPD